MKFFLKMIFLPIRFILWMVSGIFMIALKVSATVSTFIAILAAVVGVVSLFSGETLNGCLNLAAALLLCPYGLPSLAAVLLAKLYSLRFTIKKKIYG